MGIGKGRNMMQTAQVGYAAPSAPAAAVSYMPVHQYDVTTLPRVTQQPPQQHQQVVVTQPQTTTTTTHIATGTGKKADWSSDLCDCKSDIKSCLCFALCSCCFYCTLSARMNEHFCVPFLVPGGIITLRSVFRAKHNIQGDICGDCFTAACCPCCTPCQLMREMDHYGYPVKHCCCC